jgi:hypothetical protein
MQAVAKIAGDRLTCFESCQQSAIGRSKLAGYRSLCQAGSQMVSAMTNSAWIT